MTALAAWNALPAEAAVAELLSCCGSRAWAASLAGQRPFVTETDLFREADAAWWSVTPGDWLEAFRRHPCIGGNGSAHASRQSGAWSSQEQAQVRSAAAITLEALAQGNRDYEARHGFIYIVCASGKSADEMLAILLRRLANDTQTELREAAEQQRQITQIRLRKWLAP